MASFNKVILIGNLTADPELKRTTSGVSVCRFTLAVNRRFAKADQGQQTADFITVVAWRQSADFVARFFKKGRPILVCCQIQSRSWTDNQNVKHYASEVLADEVSFVDSGNGRPGDGVPAGGGQENYTPDAYSAPSFSNGNSSGFEELSNDDGLPF